MSFCEYINKHNIQCISKSKAIYNLNDKYYCKNHFERLSKKEQKKQCEYITKTNKECITKAKEEYILNNSYYCKKHFNILNKKIFKEEPEEYTKEKPEESAKEDSKETKKLITYCSINNCKKKISKNYNNLDLCLTHYTKIIINEKNEIMKEVKRLTKVIITENTKSKIKKDIYKLLLIIHPDKCKNPHINSTELTQEINKILEKIKIK
jgi:hypothetical protein